MFFKSELCNYVYSDINRKLWLFGIYTVSNLNVSIMLYTYLCISYEFYCLVPINCNMVFNSGLIQALKLVTATPI